MIRSLLAPLLLACATLAHAADSRAVHPCAASDTLPARHALDEHGGPLKVDTCYAWTDPSGDYRLYWLHSADRQDGEYTLSKSLAAQLFRKQPDGTLASQWVIRDKIGEGEAGAWFSRHLSEFPDLDGNGVVTPILVIRFVPAGDGPGEPVDYGAYAGRLKILMFRGDTKIAIRAVTGGLDDERHTTASDSFFELPRRQQRYLQRKMRGLTKDELFVFDDARDFMPRRDKPAKAK